MTTDLVRIELERLLPRLWRFCLALSRDRAVAEDLVQSACVRALERAAQFEPGTRLDHWVFRIARTIWLNELRSQRVRGSNDAVQVEALEARNPGPEWMVLRDEVFTSVLALPEKQRTAVTLVYVEGFSYAEAAEIMDVPTGTLMSRLATARRTLGQALNQSAPGQTVRPRAHGEQKAADR